MEGVADLCLYRSSTLSRRLIDMSALHQSSFHTFYSTDYAQAKARFCTQARSLNAYLWSYPINQNFAQEELTIDVARFGPKDAKKLLVISSGTHGVEGFYGSAVQLAILTMQVETLAHILDVAIVLIHAVNPYGFYHLRRVNEDNIDLNRNCLSKDEVYAGVDPHYTALDQLLNPKSAPQSYEFFTLKALFQIVRHGFQALKSSIAQGQYEFEKGLFFGGRGPSRSQELITAHLSEWLGQAQRIIHLDLHSGLGRWGQYVLATSRDLQPKDFQWLMSHFDQDRVQNLHAQGVLYPIRGEFTYFCKQLMEDRQYYPILVEFGTYPILKVLQALRQENRATHWSDPNSSQLKEARILLQEIFCPQSRSWRTQVTQKSLRVVEQALKALS